MFVPIGDEESRPGSTAFVVMALIAINVAIFVAEAQILQHGQRAEQRLFYEYGAVPYFLTRAPFDYWPTVFSSMFMHGGWMHLVGNMLFMWIFADNIEDLLGEVGFVIFYLLCGVAALVAHVAMDPASKVPVVGASGAISGVLGAYITMFPHNGVRNFYWFWFIVGVTTLPAWMYLGVWFLMQLFFAAGQEAGAAGVAFAAHAGGFVAGMILISVFPKRQEAIDYYRWRTS